MAHSSAPAVPPDLSSALFGWLRLWFLLRDPVPRRPYAITGFGLMFFKYMVEFVVVSVLTGLLYTPLDFFSPLISARSKFLQGMPDGLGLIWVLWTLPFLWICVSMSVRRALDGGISPWHGLWVLVPFVNLLAMLVLACLPTSNKPASHGNAEEQPTELHEVKEVAASLRSALGGIAVGALYALVIILFSIYLLNDYGAVLFFGTPFVTGLATAYLFNLDVSRSTTSSIFVAFVAVMLTGVGMLLFAVEGLICLAMAAPIVAPLGIVGAPLGKFLADRRRRLHRGLAGCLIAMPLLATIEAGFPSDTAFVVVSTVEIAAPRERVWQQVIAFPDIEEPPEFFFRMGISCPVGAEISGSGVGATRECIFTTGRFIEPITVWDEPRRLAFDVREQPAPMFELTPYRHIHPPHLDGAFRSTRGEFELIALEDGGTRLVGRTWYTLDIRPHGYWTVWTDWIVHRIHQRVLRHIKRLAESAES